MMPWYSSGSLSVHAVTPFLCLPNCRCCMRGIIMWPLHCAIGGPILLLLPSSGNTQEEHIRTGNLNCSKICIIVILVNYTNIIVIIYWFNIYEHTLLHSNSLAHAICATDMNDTTNCVTCRGKVKIEDMSFRKENQDETKFVFEFVLGVWKCKENFFALWGGDHRPAFYDWQTRTVWLKHIKIETTVETKTPTSWMPLR